MEITLDGDVYLAKLKQVHNYLMIRNKSAEVHKIATEKLTELVK